MANFCTKCGAKLEAGKTHKCEAKEEKKVEAKTTSNSNVDVKEGFTDCVEAVKGIFTKPIDTIKKFVSDSKFITGIILIVATALMSGLSRVLTLWHIYGDQDYIKPKYFDEFFESFVTDLGKYVAIAFIAYLIISVILKGKATWKETLSATGLSLIVTFFAIVINTILVFFEGDLVAYIAGYVSVFASAFSVMILYEGLKLKAELDNNKLFLTLGSTYVCAAIVVDLLAKIFK